MTRIQPHAAGRRRCHEVQRRCPEPSDRRQHRCLPRRVATVTAPVLGQRPGTSRQSIGRLGYQRRPGHPPGSAAARVAALWRRRRRRALRKGLRGDWELGASLRGCHGCFQKGSLGASPLQSPQGRGNSRRRRRLRRCRNCHRSRIPCGQRLARASTPNLRRRQPRRVRLARPDRRMTSLVNTAALWQRRAASPCRTTGTDRASVGGPSALANSRDDSDAAHPSS